MRVVRRFTSLFTIAMMAAAMWSCFGDDGVDAVAQLQADVKAIDDYLASKSITAFKDKSGLRFSITEFGTKGFPPRLDQTIKAKYVGKYLDGTVFDDGSKEANGLLSSYILGWQYGLSVWPQGTKGTLYIPSSLAFGSQQVGSIPANSVVMFDVELISVEYTNAEKARLVADIDIIDKYLQEKAIEAVEDTTGVRYVVTAPGEGPHPGFYSTVKLKAVGKTLAGNKFVEGTAEPNEFFDSRVADYIHGMKIGLMNIGKGGKVTVYIPSGLAYGPNPGSQSGIAANTNIIYELELTDIIDQ